MADGCGVVVGCAAPGCAAAVGLAGGCGAGADCGAVVGAAPTGVGDGCRVVLGAEVVLGWAARCGAGVADVDVGWATLPGIEAPGFAAGPAAGTEAVPGRAAAPG